MTGSFIHVKHSDDGVAVITLDRPKVNALCREMLEQLSTAANELSADPPGAVILTGGEKIFAAGADISEFGGVELAREVGALFHSTTAALEAIPCVTIAAINGVALGGGCEIALACDLRIAGDASSLGQPEILLGIIPGGGGTQRLARLIGTSRAKDVILSGRMISAVEALQMGLVNKVVPEAEVQAAASKIAKRYAAGPLAAQALAKRAIDDGAVTDMASGLKIELDCFGEVFETEDAQIGIDSFLEQGPGKAKFTGK